MKQARPWLSVIIPARDRAEELAACLRSLAACGERGLEVIVVGECLTDARTLAREMPLAVSLIHQPGLSAGAARNLGAMRALGEVLFFTLPSCRVPPGLPARLKQLFADPDLSAAGGGARPLRPDHRLSRLSALEASYEQGGTDLELEPCPAMVCAAFRTSVFKSAGMCDELIDHGQGNDHDLCDRIMDTGGAIVCAPELWVEQVMPLSWPEVWRLQIQRGQARYQELRAGRHLTGSAYLQPILLLISLGLLALLGPRDPGRAASLALICLLLLYPANRRFLKYVSENEPGLLKTAFLFCLLRPAAWVVGMLKGALGRLGFTTK